ncbi:MAG: hypothetical protein DRN08_02015 [Thermoplasmata archaeon]|nr:MAG: hypothetical protein DRN05_05475 [Thermoplasmata archaeon]RLF36080.1 MAG: hypothetical protein DRN08_02015 [Thermoplasmata archaeon]
MARLNKTRNIIRELTDSPLIEKISFLLPFVVLLIDIVILEHAVRIREGYIIVLTTLLFVLSTVEIVVVLDEIHRHYQKNNFERKLTIKLDDFIIKRRKRSVKNTVEDFIREYPEYNSYRNEVYHIACQIMETHKEEKYRGRK